MNSNLTRSSWMAFGFASALTTSMTQATERNWSYTYNAQGLIETADGPRTDVSDVTRYEYDDRNRLTRIINALGHVVELMDFNFFGSPMKIMNANGIISDLSYSPQGWLTSINTAGNTTKIEYNSVGDITKLTRGDGSWLAYVWDDARRLTGITNTAGERVSYDLNPMGKRTAQKLHDSEGRQTHQREWIYDELGRVIQAIGAGGQLRKFQYDLNDNAVQNLDPRGNKFSTTYDALDRLVQSINSMGGITRYDYDTLDNVSHVEDPRGLITEYAYDTIGNLIQWRSPDSGTNTYQRDLAGNVVQRTDANGSITIFAYDVLNRLTDRQHPDQPELNIKYIYDEDTDERNGVGRLTSIESDNGTMMFSYDKTGKLKKQIQNLKMGEIVNSTLLRYGYDKANQVVTIDYPSQISIDYERDAAGQVRAIKWRHPGSTSMSIADNLTYLPFGPLTSLTWGSGQTLVREYNQDYQMTQQKIADLKTAYEYDANGNIVQHQNGLLGELTYTYDSLNRLSSETSAVQQQTLTYDAVGNRTNKTTVKVGMNVFPSDSEMVYGYDDTSNRLMSINGATRVFDAAGNLTATEDQSFEYDDQNRLIRIKKGEEVKASFLYNALGQRTHKTNRLYTTTFIYGFKGELVAENRFDNAGKKVTSQYYIWIDGAPLAGILVKYDNQGSVVDRTPFFIHSDHLNTPRMVTDANGEVIWRWISDAFGVGKAEGSLSLNLRFPGQYFDDESGLHYNYYRDYDPETGRYIQGDPIGLRGGLNNYGYVNGNPIIAVDKKGLEATVIYVEGLIPHSALHVDDGSGQPFLYDPAGSYVGPSNLPRGSGDFFEGSDASLQSYIDYWNSDGDNVHTYPLGTTRHQDKLLIDRAVDRPSAPPFTCANSVSAVLDGMCGVAPSSWPSTLGKNASQSNCK